MSYNPAFRNVIDRCIREQGRQSGPRLPIPVHPRPDEGFADLLTRAATENGYATRRQILKILLPDHGDISWNFAALFRKGIDPMAVSHFLGNRGGPDELLPLMTCPETSVGERSFYFFGARLGNWYVNHGRRVSPRALANDLYLRATWNVRSLAFDPDTKEMLLERCPVCEAALSDKTTIGLQFCERCAQVTRDGSIKGVDLRGFPQAIVPQELWRSLDFASGLVDPRIEKQAAAISLVPRDLAGCCRATVFQLICYLARNLKTTGRASRESIQPQDLAVAAKAVMEWPEGFANYVETFHDRRQLDVTKRSDRRAILGRKAVSDIPIPFLKTVRYQLEMNRFTASPHHAMAVGDFAAKAAHHHRDLSMLGNVSAHPAVQSLIDETGLPVAVVASVVSAGLANGKANSEGETSERCGQLLWRLTSQRSKPLSTTGHLVRLDRAVGAIWHRYGNPWGRILTKICDASLRSSRSTRSPSTVTQTYVAMEDLYEVLQHEPGSPIAFEGIPLSLADVAFVLGLDPSTVSRLRKWGILPRQIFSRDVLEIRKSFVTARELLNRRFSHSPGLLGNEVYKTLVDLGIEPIFDDEHLRIWSRNEVEKTLKGRIVPLVI